MNGLDARYTFLPWLRRGLSAAIGEGATLTRHLQAPVEISFGAGRTASVVLEMIGPGEVAGLDPRVVSRTWPRANVRDAEPNFFPMVEFDQADLPWRYTPAAAPATDRLQPWLCLIVLRDQEISELTPPSATRPLSTVAVNDATLPRLDQAWAWAHAQVTGVDGITPIAAMALLATEPHRLTARILCPRRLEPQTSYTAFLVPTFESGRRAGLGLLPDDSADPLAPAWAPDTRTIALPVYHQWRFATGIDGDFEELVKRLRPGALPATVGRRAMDVSDPGADLPGASTAPMGMEGALRSPAMERTTWADAEREPFTDELAGFLDRPTELLADGNGTRAVSAPLYGRWYAARDRFEPGTEPRWFAELNADPRWRVAAGLGAQVVQANQEQLMAAAWHQVAGLPAVNDTLRHAQFSRELALQIRERHFARADDEHVLQITSPVHQRVRASPITIAARLAESPVADGLLSAGWRRVTRPLGPIGRRQNRARGERSSVIARVNQQELSAAPPPPTPEVLATPSRAGKSLVPAGTDVASIARLHSRARWLTIFGVVLVVSAGAILIGGAPLVFVALAGGVGVASIASAMRLRPLADELALKVALRDGAITPELIGAAPARPRFVVREEVGEVPAAAEAGGTAAPAAGSGAASRREPGDSPSARAFRQAATAMLERVAFATVEAPAPRPVPLRELRDRLIAELDPHTTIAARLRDRLHIAGGLVWQPNDPLEPVLAGPDFPQPMYRHLAELSKAWLLPGLEHVQSNVVALAETNQPFVEAFMLGLNHEMGRELLWREYPADQRRTCFRQFWDSRGFVHSPGVTSDPSALLDIKPIHQWPATAVLGENGARTTASGEQLVVLIRGDVVHRYPTLSVYAARAILDGDGQRVPGTEERQPIFSGALEPDILFFGFTLTESEVRGSGIPGEGDQGWFFILQEQASEPRFGLDVGQPGDAPPPTWNDLSWGQLVTAASGWAAVDYIDLNAELPDTQAITAPPGVAWHADSGLGASGTTAAELGFITLQRPMRIAVHAGQLLPAATS